MKVSEIMHQGVICAKISDSIRQVASIMKENDIGALPILENEKIAGFVTDRDIVLACAGNGASLDDQISSAMSPDIISITPDKDVTEAAELMEQNQISRLLVVEGNNPVGIISLQNLTMNVDNSHLKSEVLEEIKH